MFNIIGNEEVKLNLLILLRIDPKKVVKEIKIM